MIRCLRWFVMLIAVIAGPVAATLARFEVPIALVTLSDGAPRYTIPIAVDGVPLVVGLDTGSTGLRIMARAVPAAADARGPHSSQSYSGGVRIDGVLLGRQVAIGGTSAKVAIERIDVVGCVPARPQCPGNRLAIEDYGLQDDGLKGEGFPAIIGVAMGEADAPNPLIALGITRWIVELPRAGDVAPGRLIVEPSDEEVATFTRIRLIDALRARRGGVHDAVPGCLVRTDTDARQCGPVLLDSGAPGIRITLPRGEAWPPGTPGLLAIGDGAIERRLPFVAGRRDQSSRMIVDAAPEGAVPHISAGIMPYLGWAVLYDARAGAIGVKPRDPVASRPQKP